MPPTRVSEMISDTWASSAAGTGLPTTCTVVSEGSLAAAAAAVVGDSNPAEQVAQVMVENYPGRADPSALPGADARRRGRAVMPAAGRGVADVAAGTADRLRRPVHLVGRQSQRRRPHPDDSERVAHASGGGSGGDPRHVRPGDTRTNELSVSCLGIGERSKLLTTEPDRTGQDPDDLQPVPSIPWP